MTTNNDYLTRISPVTLGHTLDPKRPVLPYWKQVSDAMCSEPHSHPRGQLIFSSKGITRVMTNEAVYLVPSSQAFWCPPNQRHELIFPGAVDIANLFIDPVWAKYLSPQQQVFNVTPLVKELILKAVNIGCDYSFEGKEYRLMTVLMDEIAALEVSPLTLPWSEHSKLEPVMQRLIDDPCINYTIDQWAALIHVSPRTLARLFNQEVNMTFSEWRIQVRIFYALEQLHAGRTVTYVALALGYSTPSAFIAAFRKLLGQSPLAYLSAAGG